MYGIGARLLQHSLSLPRIGFLATATRGLRVSLPLSGGGGDGNGNGGGDCGQESPLKFEFDAENKKRIKALLSCWPEEEKRGALLPLLDLAQRQYGWLPVSAISLVATMLDLEPFAVWEVANFYTMFRLKPTGKYIVSVCQTTPCYLRGSDDLMKTCQALLQLKPGETSKDMQFSLKNGYCMGACVNGPCASINDDIYEDLTQNELEVILCELKCGKVPISGPRGRFASEPKSGLTSLMFEPPPAGFEMQELCITEKK